MNKPPLVSVLITPYNQKDYIRQTLDSILMQKTQFDFEVVIGEDCSTDGTREICQEYAQAYPQQIVLCLNERNKGFINNYFDVFLKAKGVYIADCGGDDYWLTETKLQEQVDLLEAHQEVSLVAGNWQLYDQKRNLLRQSDSWIHQDWFQPEGFGEKAVANYLNLNDIPRIVLAASCFRGDWAREAYHNNPDLFRGQDVVCEDLPLTMGLLMKGPFFISKNNWLVYRVLEKSLSHSPNQDEYLKGFAFSAFKQTVCLVAKLGIPMSAIQSYLLDKIGEFVVHTVLKEDIDFSSRLQAFCKEQRINVGLKSRILFYCLKQPLLSKCLRAFYRKRYKHA
ncbi:MAG TPA: glycosyltransferase [Bacteroidales bacterium]|nr:glycosyltransferase [Bacteroidales bacterium]